METISVNGVDLEYEVRGTGEPVLLISTGPIADSFRPLVAEGALAESYCLITYHQRGQAGSAPIQGVVTFEQHAADAAALLRRLGISRAHVVGHSTGGVVALQLALDSPELVQSLVLLEPLLMNVPSAAGFINSAGPALAAYGAGNREQAMALFLSTVSGLDWDACRATIEAHVPGGVAQAMHDADTVFCSYLPALQAWAFGAPEAATIRQPTLSVVGTQTEALFVDGRALLRSWFPGLQTCDVEGTGHLLHMQRPEPTAVGVAQFLARQPMIEQMSEPAPLARE